ncbi:hypothetical protein [Rheinheimera sp.]|uniref:hypothetical protein n=1 Tax=Rheinheimera sp. TaxID=1869214 RepID=UPI00307DD1E9
MQVTNSGAAALTNYTTTAASTQPAQATTETTKTTVSDSAADTVTISPEAKALLQSTVQTQGNGSGTEAEDWT